MRPRTNTFAWITFASLAIIIGFYPLVYLFVGRDFGLLASKSDLLLESQLWHIAFYGHILLGGIALLTGWSQLSRRLRQKYLNAHRKLGKIYVITVVLSGLCSIYLSFYATGGWVTGLGFFSLGIFWLYFTIKAFLAARSGNIEVHRGFMIYSYAACFGAVTLRIWMPLLILIFGEFLIAYKIVAWLAWVPNLIFAYFWIRRQGFRIA